jgi:hypothetical protein
MHRKYFVFGIAEIFIRISGPAKSIPIISISKQHPEKKTRKKDIAPFDQASAESLGNDQNDHKT